MTRVARRKPGGSGYEWAAMGQGIFDWIGQFRPLKRDWLSFSRA